MGKIKVVDGAMMPKSLMSIVADTPQSEMAGIKQALAALDYKTIKNVEAFLSSLPSGKKGILPYDVDEIASEKTALQDAINSIKIEVPGNEDQPIKTGG